ncbi:MAG: hypothetical protein COB59_01835 [Rhodospirillaceae bacterium]|nr:MAG: hypothetical protein COB59_01835 [Rhodospirillaceae bacterium]
MNALKGIIIIMTLAIATLMTLIVYGLYQKSQNADFKFFDFSDNESTTSEVMPSAPVSGTSVPVTAFGNIQLDLPAGASIVSATPSGTQLIVITSSDGTKGDQVWVLDLATGKVLSRINTGQ